MAELETATNAHISYIELELLIRRIIEDFSLINAAQIKDIVIGAMDNDQVFNYINDYVDGILTKEQFWVLAKFKKPINQICFCSDNALKCLKYIESLNID